MPSKAHSSLSTPFSTRAEAPNTPPLASYLLSLISIKRSNLCVSADVHTTWELLSIAEEVGDSICLLKTHADIIDDFSEKTIQGLQEIAQRKHFLIFEDRKLGDIGSACHPSNPLSPGCRSQLTRRNPTDTVQSQYTRGPLAIATWAHLTNAHLLPGSSIIPTLHAAALQTLVSLNQSVATTITTGTPRVSLDSTGNDFSTPATTTLVSVAEPSTSPITERSESDSSNPTQPEPIFSHSRRQGRAGSQVSATTTISQTFEPMSPKHPASLIHVLSIGEEDDSFQDKERAFEELGPPPQSRGLLLLAQMSSEGNLMTLEYTRACVAAARKNKEFVLGFVSQRSLNEEAEDAFLHFTPGVSLPPEGEADANAARGDGKGQKWRLPKEVVGKDGADVVIVGRGILGAEDRGREAERYREASWRAYEGRIGRK
ncbi:orotidine 5'-phosphate decarboxylase [Mycoblastus sanguinarius]|nr:orotidine 5'-phosphate decarboxylase [Mycoblastus sanguinarius]